MTKSFLVFPSGWAGAALLLLRGALAAALAAGTQLTDVAALQVAVAVVAVALLAGFCTRILAGIAAVIGFALAAHLAGPLGFSAAMHSLCAIAVSVLGAGGYSIDARLFGRKIIDLDR